MKNFVKEGQKLPLYGVGPYIILGMGAVTLLGIVFFCFVFKIGLLQAPWTVIFRTAGVVLIAAGIAVWLVSAFRSDMDDNIAANRLKTDGIYAWVRNPMYSGWWFLFAGISFMWADLPLLITIPAGWAIMTVALKGTEEKWLLDLYGDEYAEYMKKVNRCIPRMPKRKD